MSSGPTGFFLSKKAEINKKKLDLNKGFNRLIRCIATELNYFYVFYH